MIHIEKLRAWARNVRRLAAGRFRVAHSLFVLTDGAAIPRGFGVAYYRYDTLTALALPIPINFIVGWAHRLYAKMKLGPDPAWLEKRLRLEREAGFKDGVDHALGTLLERLDEQRRRLTPG
jgi:hypothetical protein